MGKMYIEYSILFLSFLIILVIVILSFNFNKIPSDSFTDKFGNSISARTNGLENSIIDDLYIVYSISNSPYQEWQADLLDFSVKASGQPGKIIRTVSDDPKYPNRPVSKPKDIITIQTEDFGKYGGGYAAMNKSGGLREIIKLQKSLGISDSSVMIQLDPDMIFTKVWDPRNIVKQGTIYGQQWHGYSKDYCKKSTLSKFKDYCPDDNKAMMYPFAITMGDIVKITPKYFESSANYIESKDWMTEMSALVISENDPQLGLTVITSPNIGITNDWLKYNQDPEAPIMHYCQTIKDSSGKEIWGKRKYNAWDPVPDPKLATTRVDREVLTMLQKIISAHT